MHEHGRGGQDVQELCTIMSSTRVLFAPKGWAQSSMIFPMFCLAVGADAETQLEGMSFSKAGVCWLGPF